MNFLKIRSVAAAVLLLTLSTACDKMAENQKKADDVHAKVNEKLTEVNKDADAKLKAAQAEADKKAIEAKAAFARARDDYKVTSTAAIADLDKRIAALETKARKSKAKAKKELDLKVKQLKEKRDAFSTEVSSIESSTEQTWDETKAKLDKKWEELKAFVD